MNWIEANGVALRYDLGGRGAETVVMVHEKGGSLDSWDGVLPAFQQHFRTLRYDQRGFGQSEKVCGKLTLEDMLGDIAALLAALDITAPCHFVGSALGAGIAIAYTARNPGRVTRLAVSSPVTGFSSGSQARKDQYSDTAVREGMRAIVEPSLKASYPDIMRADKARFEAFRARWLTNDPHCFAAMNRMGNDLNLNPELRNIACPTLVIAPVHDLQRSPAIVKPIAGQIPGARYVEAESSHFLAVQTPDLFAQHVVPFLRGL